MNINSFCWVTRHTLYTPHIHYDIEYVDNYVGGETCDASFIKKVHMWPCKEKNSHNFKGGCMENIMEMREKV